MRPSVAICNPTTGGTVDVQFAMSVFQMSSGRHRANRQDSPDRDSSAMSSVLLTNFNQVRGELVTSDPP
jgi:hypothetical protein